ncbi:hypothetical protein F5148DRAFT_1232783 [Russula earlei]|uniref:Uncharacterized protein n=1 Tax=Russula earlei TaxID=71964 RepID=A0ACC0U014_9AGAM|nr:hypothetical protein F5148DRAFT_1232783 [Russula earlei]
MTSHSNVQRSAIIALDLFQLAFFSPFFSLLRHATGQFPHPETLMARDGFPRLRCHVELCFLGQLSAHFLHNLTMLLSVDVMIFYFPLINDLNLYPFNWAEL